MVFASLWRLARRLWRDHSMICWDAFSKSYVVSRFISSLAILTILSPISSNVIIILMQSGQSVVCGRVHLDRCWGHFGSLKPKVSQCVIQSELSEQWLTCVCELSTGSVKPCLPKVRETAQSWIYSSVQRTRRVPRRPISIQRKEQLPPHPRCPEPHLLLLLERRERTTRERERMLSQITFWRRATRCRTERSENRESADSVTFWYCSAGISNFGRKVKMSNGQMSKVETPQDVRGLW